MVFRYIPRRKREKSENVYSGPHRILNQLGNFSYEMVSITGSRKIKANVNDLKLGAIPCITEWKLNEQYFKNCKNEWKVDLQHGKVHQCIGSILQMLVDRHEKGLKLFEFAVIPEWSCSTWYAYLQNHVAHRKLALPDEDLFVTKNDQPIGKFAWSWSLVIFD